ncbi:hypothetical protein NC653_019575 [Populus alba x Populus x berolinensis]|uniref:Uncharacterized protein n=1 Tax=Populus alba x Populus x berolinensis TaxID=444605 RepID=A0AAD6VXL5_9ROSI|nr:hypothetical protein NC653_019575 [Populus alba x Populus x berolinensis]
MFCTIQWMARDMMEKGPTDKSANRIMAIDLDAAKNDGHISPSSVFKHLTVLDLSDHRLSSPIPQEIPTLPLVFSARIPVEYGPKPGSSWKILFLEDNFLTENPPPQFIDRTVAVCNSLARNCSRCPLNIRFCRGQRPG